MTAQLPARRGAHRMVMRTYQPNSIFMAATHAAHLGPGIARDCSHIVMTLAQPRNYRRNGIGPAEISQAIAKLESTSAPISKAAIRREVGISESVALNRTMSQRRHRPRRRTARTGRSPGIARSAAQSERLDTDRGIQSVPTRLDGRGQGARRQRMGPNGGGRVECGQQI